MAKYARFARPVAALAPTGPRGQVAGLRSVPSRRRLGAAGVDLGVEAGDVIGLPTSSPDHGAAPLHIRANRAGHVIMMHLSARPVKGQTLYVVAEPVDWREVTG